MITRLTLPIDILHDERIVALVADCGPQSIAVLISLLAILRRRGDVARDRYLITKIRHDLSYTLDEAAINAVIDHLIGSGYLQAQGEMVRQAHGGMGRHAPSGNVASVDTPDSVDSTASIDSPMRRRDAPSSLSPDAPASQPPASIPSFENYADPFCADVWPHLGPYTLEEVIGAYRCRYVQQNLEKRRKSSLQTHGVEISISEDLAMKYYEQFSDSWLERGYPVINLGRSLSDWIVKTAVKAARRKAKASKRSIHDTAFTGRPIFCS